MASEKKKIRYDARTTGHDFHEGNKVWLWNPKRRKGLSSKLQKNWEGPYTVLKRLNDVVVRIQKFPHSKPKADCANDIDGSCSHNAFSLLCIIRCLLVLLNTICSRVESPQGVHYTPDWKPQVFVPPKQRLTLNRKNKMG
ncbi:kinectin [Trichonephila clavipes]|nr:kinectin [Trichonephila clavipes]